MNRPELIEKVSKTTLMNKNQVELVIAHTLDAITRNIINGESVVISGFGTFTRIKRRKRNGTNPQTGEAMLVDARWSPKIKFSPVLKAVVRNNAK